MMTWPLPNLHLQTVLTQPPIPYTIHMNVLSYTHMLSETLAIGNSIVSGPTVISRFVGLLQMQLMFKDTTLLVLVGSFIVDTVQDMMRRYLRITPIQ